MSTSTILQDYLKKTPVERIDSGFIAYLASLDKIASVSPLVASNIVQELAD